MELGAKKPHAIDAHFIASNWLGRSNVSFITPWKNRRVLLDTLVESDILSATDEMDLIGGRVEIADVQPKIEPWLEGKFSAGSDQPPIIDLF